MANVIPMSIIQTLAEDTRVASEARIAEYKTRLIEKINDKLKEVYGKPFPTGVTLNLYSADKYLPHLSSESNSTSSSLNYLYNSVGFTDTILKRLTSEVLQQYKDAGYSIQYLNNNCNHTVSTFCNCPTLSNNQQVIISITETKEKETNEQTN